MLARHALPRNGSDVAGRVPAPARIHGRVVALDEEAPRDVRLQRLPKRAIEIDLVPVKLDADPIPWRRQGFKSGVLAKAIKDGDEIFGRRFCGEINHRRLSRLGRSRAADAGKRRSRKERRRAGSQAATGNAFREKRHGGFLPNQHKTKHRRHAHRARKASCASAMPLSCFFYTAANLSIQMIYIYALLFKYQIIEYSPPCARVQAEVRFISSA